MLPRLEAGQQLMAIEAALVPHMKADAAKRVVARHGRATKPPEERKPASMQLLEGFREAGFPIVHE